MRWCTPLTLPRGRAPLQVVKALRARAGDLPAGLTGVCGDGMPCALRVLAAAAAAEQPSYAAFSAVLLAGASAFETRGPHGRSAFDRAVADRDHRALQHIAAHAGCPADPAVLLRGTGGGDGSDAVRGTAGRAHPLAMALYQAKDGCPELLADAAGAGRRTSKGQTMATHLRGINTTGLVAGGTCDGAALLERLGQANAAFVEAVLSIQKRCGLAVDLDKVGPVAPLR